MYGIPNFWANPSIGNPMLCTITSNQPFEAILNHPKTGVSPKVNTNCGWFTIELISLIYCNICKLQRMLLVWARLQDRTDIDTISSLLCLGIPNERILSRFRESTTGKSWVESEGCFQNCPETQPWIQEKSRFLMSCSWSKLDIRRPIFKILQRFPFPDGKSQISRSSGWFLQPFSLRLAAWLHSAAEFGHCPRNKPPRGPIEVDGSE
jgi:hypothetical protein